MAVNGKLQDIPLTTLISINCTECSQSRLKVWTANQQANLFFDKGQIVHIEMGQQHGEEVIYELLTWEEGQFELEMDVPAPAQTVSTPWSNLVLEGMRRIDEDDVQADIELEDWAENNEQDVQDLEALIADTLDTQSESLADKGENLVPKEVPKMARRRSEVLTETLEGLLQDSSDIHGAVVVGADGLVLSSNLPMGGHDASRVGAEGAALVGLSKRALGSLKCGDFQVAILQGRDGWVIVSSAGSQAMVLGLTNAGVNLGMALLEMRDIAADVADTMG
jgi:predicted regulator of Ras-like GTPase activity (Roadblock/LC7/MglB family)